MNSTSLDINVSETLANKTLIVTTILVRSQLPHTGEFRCVFLCGFSGCAGAPAVLWSVSANSAVAVTVIESDRALREMCKIRLFFL